MTRNGGKQRGSKAFRVRRSSRADPGRAGRPSKKLGSSAGEEARPDTLAAEKESEAGPELLLDLEASDDGRPMPDEAFRKVLTLLKTRFHVDLAHYKLTTIRRRV